MSEKSREQFELKYTVPEGAEFMESSSHYVGGISVTGLTLLNIQWDAWKASRDSLALKFPDPSARPYQYDPYDGDAVYEQLKAIVEGAGIKVTV